MTNEIRRWVIISGDEEIFPISSINIFSEFDLYSSFKAYIENNLDTKQFIQLHERGYRAVEKVYKEVEGGEK